MVQGATSLEAASEAAGGGDWWPPLIPRIVVPPSGLFHFKAIIVAGAGFFTVRSLIHARIGPNARDLVVGTELSPYPSVAGCVRSVQVRRFEANQTGMPCCFDADAKLTHCSRSRSISLLTRILGRLYYQDSPLDYQARCQSRCVYAPSAMQYVAGHACSTSGGEG